MSSACDEFIKHIEQMLPETCSVRDLIKVGIYKSAQSAFHARRDKKCPPYMKVPGRGFIYPRMGVIDWLHKTKYTMLTIMNNEA